jgi:subtilase family serine protease
MSPRFPSSKRLRALMPVATVLLALLVAGCAGPSAAPRASHSPATSTHAKPPAPLRLGPTDPTRTIAISLVLRGQAPDQLDTTLAALNNPSSPGYHHYLTPQEFAARFGASASTLAAAGHTLTAAGLTVTGRSANGLLLDARGPVGTIESLFGVQLIDYRAADGTLFYQAVATARLPAGLASLATGVLGLDSRHALHSATLRQRPASSFGFDGYTPADLRRLYDVNPLVQAGAGGAGQTIALAEIDTFRQSDVDAYDQRFGITAPPVEKVNVNGGTTELGPESIMDIEVIHAIAPQTRIIAYQTSPRLDDTAQMFAQLVGERRAQIVSISLGVCEIGIDPSIRDAYLSSLDSSFKQAAAQGMSVLVASGDAGAYTCQDDNLAVSSPADSPYVTAVGGTALFTDSDGGYAYEAGWESPLEGAGSGGGLSEVYARPDWQTGKGVNNQYSNGMRQIPDVAADADALTGYQIYDSGTSPCNGDRCWQVYAGTSAAAPLWAGLVALANQMRAAQQKPPLGLLNPALYQFGDGKAGASPFRDVTVGGNLFYPAAAGWDFSTGWGTPDASALIQDFLSV